MAKFRDIKTLQKFSSVHASIHNHFSNANSTAAIPSSKIARSRWLKGVNWAA